MEGRLRKVIVAESRRDDIARWRGTDGHHGFLWQIPEDVAATDGARIDVVDAVTGLPLRGSPVRIEGVGWLRAGGGGRERSRSPGRLGAGWVSDPRHGPVRRGAGTKKRVCIATPDMPGPVRNGGIGTAFHHLARLLSERGHEVVIAYVNPNATDTQLMEETRAFYAGFGIGFEPIVPRPADKGLVALVSAPTWALLDWLQARERPFDIVHVSEWQGLGYGSLLAKSLGLAFGTTHFVVKGSSPTLWRVEGNRQLLPTERELGWVFMERRSIELADTVMCGSTHLPEWMRKAGYALPERSFVWPNPFPVPDPSPEAAAERAARDGARLEEVVFFGRLERRKGLIVFVDAIDRLARRGRAPARVTFLGGRSPRFDGVRHIREHAQRWPVEVRTITDFGSEEAVGYLSQPGRLAVLPSLQENSSLAVTECLHAGIPFVAAATGGTPELVAPEDRARALVAPEHIALGERIAELAAVPLGAVRPRWEFERSLEVWTRWHAQTAPFEAAVERFANRASAAGTDTPLVTVCIVHHERPELVRMAVDSVVAQDYPALEAVLVDDGSESAGALAALDALEAEFGERGWRVIRQENRYLGARRATRRRRWRGASGCCFWMTTTSCFPTRSPVWCGPRDSPVRTAYPRRVFDSTATATRGPTLNPAGLRFASSGPRVPGAGFAMWPAMPARWYAARRSRRRAASPRSTGSGSTICPSITV